MDLGKILVVSTRVLPWMNGGNMFLMNWLDDLWWLYCWCWDLRECIVAALKRHFVAVTLRATAETKLAVGDHQPSRQSHIMRCKSHQRPRIIHSHEEYVTKCRVFHLFTRQLPYVYVIQSLCTKKFYVGSSNDPSFHPRKGQKLNHPSHNNSA